MNQNQILEFIKNISNIQKNIQTLEFTGSSGGDLVKVKMNGKLDILQLKIDPSILQRNDISLLEDLIKSALNNTINKVRKNWETNTLGHKI